MAHLGGTAARFCLDSDCDRHVDHVAAGGFPVGHSDVPRFVDHTVVVDPPYDPGPSAQVDFLAAQD